MRGTLTRSASEGVKALRRHMHLDVDEMFAEENKRDHRHHLGLSQWSADSALPSNRHPRSSVLSLLSPFPALLSRAARPPLGLAPVEREFSLHIDVDRQSREKNWQNDVGRTMRRMPCIIVLPLFVLPVHFF